MKELFVEKTFRSSSKKLIEQADVIIGELAADGYSLTVRQLYYQFVARGLLANKQTNYKRLAKIMDDARKAGLIDWDAIEDRTRILRRIPTFGSPEHFIRTEVRNYYYEDLWRNQDYYCEVWVEKDALLGVIERPCNDLRVPYFACRGYASSSALYEAGNRFARQMAAGKECVLFHLGDHDPSGLDMTRVNREDVNLFARAFEGVEVRRLALNMDQIEEYNPPPNPAKDSDSRYNGYVEQHGESSWELDALNPRVIDKLIRDNIEQVLDRDTFDADEATEDENRDTLLDMARRWDEVVEFLKPEETTEGDDAE